MQLNKYIDHTLLKSNVTRADIKKLCIEARECGFFSVCVNPLWVSFCKKELADSEVKTVCVIGFPLGANTSAIKSAETKQAVIDGADEIDMVLALGLFLGNEAEAAQKDIEEVVKAANGKPVKVILETHLLTNGQKKQACEIAKTAGAQFVKTSTGFTGGGATIADVKLMRATVGVDMGVKASGGIANQNEALAMIEAGANRLGASKGVAIVTGTTGDKTTY
ncbi:MAG: deoxyribose-phosphate aldolase [Candidatus Kerfeldbacteria bacterium RIFOXYA2_FULL_38_24]|uniref:Deoxyribose-phosphate aldolase n=1 Tax=Candidatus Kerfeldbacteria bacterium RIFOXYB2_FULL_38_14 TaxID=1798547 RepID=A0A1G2BAP9_9BACT|nr:MAG: deoxyribose-phosphate aldolase [Candidatus Kerfeldbacteria bacterium RIFOXYA2_FULL_38_24]OGY85679.1 MAG: deoxyribose-phosphate aldolase [Candidatus Kerfeldbacteria bacterium RIFOXYB2_FULL_38_14]OGY88365.1 MAG: deoxyribose-phosphate aldolase [Candidatus Kerfeldbacteria bacterium RIFOXYC2_FULL_38_9]